MQWHSRHSFFCAYINFATELIFNLTLRIGGYYNNQFGKVKKL